MSGRRDSNPRPPAPKADGGKVGVREQLMGMIRDVFKGIGAHENNANNENSTGNVENENSTGNVETGNLKHITMNETKISPTNLCKVLAVECLNVEGETGKVELSTQQVEVVDTYIKEMLEQVNNLKQEKAELEKTINNLDGDTTTKAMPTNNAEDDNIPGAEAVDFYKKFNGLI